MDDTKKMAYVRKVLEIFVEQDLPAGQLKDAILTIQEVDDILRKAQYLVGAGIWYSSFNKAAIEQCEALGWEEIHDRRLNDKAFKV